MNLHKKESGSLDPEARNLLIFIFACVAVITTIFFRAQDAYAEKEQRTIDNVKYLVQNEEYTMYLDGDEVELSNINIEYAIKNYVLNVDNKNKKVILTTPIQKNSVKYTPPVIMP